MEVTIIQCEYCGMELYRTEEGSYLDAVIDMKIVYVNESMCPHCNPRKEKNIDE